MCKRKVLFLVLGIFMCLSFSIGAYADDSIWEEPKEFSISPQMTYINTISNDFTISAGQAYISCSIRGYSGITDSVTIYAILQQYKNGSWVAIESWSETFNDYMGSINETYTVDK